MTDDLENLTLVYLRRIDQRQERMEATLSEFLVRLTRIEEGQARVRRDQAGDAEAVVHLQAQLDRFRDDVTQIKRRLDLAD